MNQKGCVDVDEPNNQVTLRAENAEAEPKRFTFDKVLGASATQHDFFSATAKPLVDGVLQGISGTVFAYGQTEAGKTWAIQGMSDDSEHCGVQARAMQQIFEHIETDTSRAYAVHLSFLEIYNENIRDLLSDGTNNLMIKQPPGGPLYVQDLSLHRVKSKQQCLQLVTEGCTRRVRRHTMMSETSSRSHTILCIQVDSVCNSEQSSRSAKLHLVDMAGSERVGQTGCSSIMLKESVNINRSLSALHNCVTALANPKTKHVPYRDSKLTRLLQDSLGGNANTVMTCHVSPAECNHSETLSTLRYGDRAKSVTNKPRPNLAATTDPKAPQLETRPASESGGPSAPATGTPSAPAKEGASTVEAVEAAAQLERQDSRAGIAASAARVTKNDSEPLASAEDWVVVLPTSKATKAVEAMVAVLEQEGVPLISPGDFLRRFNAFVTAADGDADDEWERV